MLFELKSVFLNEGESKELTYQLDISDIDIDGVFPFKSPVTVTATAFNRASLVTLDLNCGYDYQRSCDRCSDTVLRKVEQHFTHKLAQTLVDEANDDYIETPDFTIELDEVVISDILLALPQKFLCSPDCRGLCPKCGANLNNGDCGCDRREIDPRLAILKQLIED
ncbi:MAG TPA: nucleic acid-binding protein [Ruminococcaceae bacterium]|nr:nucleic acid-binding protein [Oscillospiraceae bacterium]